MNKRGDMTMNACGTRSRWMMTLAIAVVTPMVLTLSGCSKPAPRPSPDLTVVEGEAPVVVKTSVRGEVQIGIPTEIKLQIKAAPELEWMSTTVRGVRGVSLTEGEAEEQDLKHDGQTQSRSVYVIVMPGVHGLVAVDVSWLRKGETKKMSATLAFPIHAVGAKPSTPPIGRLEKGPEGEPVQVMPSH